ncbi:MAG: DUF4424 domain-containing protein [Rhodopseudomonas sp.]|uniref:DUF4424 domain-containing protein n=1 Tax=Rhodopseudomonas sp. TaxID=1078 RepID=UPI0017DC0D02|nr:DUF4424 domain-containing protein [Rhodopseudomonas sp.]NVN86588.1 DUF4424 domain-containing protein [Rhodopseudomonas sp.]
MDHTKYFVRTVVFAALCFGCAAAHANDTMAALTTGGLVFQTNPNIEMRSEDLSISRKRIDVRYRFFNHASVDQTVTVAFPLPEVDAQEASNIAVPDDDSDNFLQFRTLIDGREVNARIEQKAFLAGRDVTARLQALKLPLQPRAKKTNAALDALPPDLEQQLTKEGLVHDGSYDAGKGMEKHVAPDWSLRTTYYWEQTFPAGRELIIEHSYAPSVGASVQTAVASKDASAQEKREYLARFCTETSFISGVAAMTKKNGGAPPPEFRIAYVLKTGANWAGPIGDFRLTVDKGEPTALVSFCETGVKKVGPTTFEVRKTNFTPTRDLDILIVDLSPQ